MGRDTLICLLLGSLVLLLYAPVREHSFICYDDTTYMNEPHVRAGLTADGVEWALTTFYFGNWHPLTWMSLMLDTDLFSGAPGGVLLTNAILHSINAVLVYLLFKSLTDSRGASLLLAALFAVHPLRAGSVAWASERKGLLSAMWALIALIAYVRYARRPHAWSVYLIALGGCLFALMSKPMAVTLPFVMLLLDIWPLGRFSTEKWRGVLVEKLPFFLLVAMASIFTFIAQHQNGAVSSLDKYPLQLRLLNATWAYGRYIWLTFWPKGLAVFYPYLGGIEGTSLPTRNVILAAATLAAALVIAILLWRRTRAPLIGLLWFAGCLFPVIGIVQVGDQSMADRYSYFPQIGLLAGIIFGMRALVQQHAIAARICVACAACAILALAIRTTVEIGYWTNSATLFSRAAEVTSHNYVAYGDYGYALAQQGDLAGAEAQYRLSIAAHPNYFPSHLELAKVLQDTGRLDEALPHYRFVIQIAPDWFPGHYNYGLALARNGREKEALGELKTAIDLQPDSAEAHYTYGLALRHTGQLAESAKQLAVAKTLAQKQHFAGLLEQIEHVTSD